jgi:hypothetical protein
MTPSEHADALAKGLHRFVAGQLPIPRLLALGWFDFVNTDRPETDDGVEMACAALLYLGTDDAGAWTGVEGVLIAVIAFLNARLQQLPTADQLRALKALLDASPVDAKAVARWFDAVYP